MTMAFSFLRVEEGCRWSGDNSNGVHFSILFVFGVIIIIGPGVILLLCHQQPFSFLLAILVPMLLERGELG
jgi:hypothetical protein